jgi:hypothetical protein
LPLALVGLSACADSGPELAEVAGSVQLDGRPLEEGSIQFIPVEGTKGPGAGGIVANGKYRIARAKGVTVGRNRVELRGFRTTGRKVQDPTGPPGALAEERVQAFPAEYNDRSTVVKDIQAGSNTIDFDVYSKPKGK